MNVIEVSDLTKRYGDRAAVDGVSFSVEEGEIFGILGPNGAGKTTTVESIVGLRTPDAGTIRVLGPRSRHGPRPAARRRRRPAPGERAARPDDRPRGARALRLVLRRPGGPAPADRRPGPRGQARHRLPQPVGRPEAAPVDRPRARRPAADRDPRRAVHRARPAGAPRHLGPHRVDPRPRRHRPPRHPPDGGGRAARRSGRRDPRRPGGRARHARGHRLDGRPGAAAPLPARRRRSRTACSPTCPRSGRVAADRADGRRHRHRQPHRGRDLRPGPPPDRRQRPADRAGEPRRRLPRPHRTPVRPHRKELS